jgi:hypothetical protein
MPHLRRLHVRSATLPCVICDASVCDLHRVQLTTLDARCSGGRPLPRCRAVVAGGRGRWQCTRGRGARTRASSTGVVGQAAGKLPYATTLWLLDAVARHATAASSDFLRSRSGGAPTGASTSADNATKTDIKTEAATTAAPSLFWSPWPRRLLIGFRPTAARLGSSVRCVCAAGCYAPLTASREGPPWAFGTGTSTAPSPLHAWTGVGEVHASEYSSVTCVGFTTTRIHSFIGKRRAWFHPGMRKRTSSRDRPH